MTFLRKSCYCARTAYTSWLLNYRMLVLGFVFMFMFTYFIKPMQELSRVFDTPMNVLEPFCAVVNSRTFLPLVIMGYMVLISDFPRLNDSAAFMLFRSGRLPWLCGQIMFLFMSSLTYILSILFSSMICVASNSFMLNAWSLVQRKFWIADDAVKQAHPFAGIDNSVLRQSRPYEALVHGIVLVVLFAVVVGCVQLVFALRQKKVISVFINVSGIAAGLIMLIVDIRLKWLFPISNCVFAWHYHSMFNYVLFPIQYSYIYFVSLIAALIILLWRMAKSCSLYATGGTE